MSLSNIATSTIDQASANVEARDGQPVFSCNQTPLYICLSTSG